MPSLVPDYRQYNAETFGLLTLCGSLSRLEPAVQKLVAEIIHLRLFSMFENLVSVVPAKLVAGAQFLDGSAPTLMARAKSTKGAEGLFHTHGRNTTKCQLRWSRASDIKDNVKYVIAATDNFVATVDQSGTLIDEVRRVRNRIAHNNSTSRTYYREVVKRHYGAYLNHVTPGTLLLTPRLSPCLLDQYIRRLRVFAKYLVRA